MENIEKVKRQILDYIKNEGPQANVQIQAGVEFPGFQVEKALEILVQEGELKKSNLPEKLSQWQFFNDNEEPQIFWYEIVKQISDERVVYRI